MMDTTVYTVHVTELDSFCAIFETIEKVYFKSFEKVHQADRLNSYIVNSYGS